MVDICIFDMARPSLPLSQHRVRVNVSLSKRVYNNCKKQHINISRLVNTMLAFHVGKGEWAHEESNPESSARQADVLPFDYRPLLFFSAEEALRRLGGKRRIWQ